MDIEQKLQRLYERQQLPVISEEASYYNESLKKSLITSTRFFSQGGQSELEKTKKYLLGAMQAMPKASTDIFYHEGKRIQNQLENELDSKYNLHPDFRFQGSVTTNTHIKAVSDIDLLVLTEKFKSYEGELPSYCHKI